MGTWKLTCPKGGEYKGECHAKHNPATGFELKCEDGLDLLKEPKDGSCDDTRSECLKKAEIKCAGGKCDPAIECKSK